jgi:hypothetical protein
VIFDDLEREKKFKESIGAFVIEFSKLEFGLVELCALTEFNIHKKNEYISKYMGYTFVKKISIISDTIKNCFPELQETWNKLESKIKEINSYRRYIIHGIIDYSFQDETTTSYVKSKKQISKNELTVEKIDDITNQVSILNTGEYGILGDFHTLFTTARVNQWNTIVSDENKIVYKVNDIMLSDWKGV